MKLWNFEGNGKNHINDVYKILKEYSDGLNQSQDVLVSCIDSHMNENSEDVLSMRLNNGYILMSCVVKFNGYADIEVNYYNRKDNHLLKIDEMGYLLDEVIKSHEMASLISHLMKNSIQPETRNYWI